MSFNGATTFPLWKSKSLNILDGLLGLASMGPQRFRCGNVLIIKRMDESQAASMGPQRFRCGNLFVSPSHQKTSRRFNGATTFPLWKSIGYNTNEHEMYMLQWGHNVSVVEIASGVGSLPKVSLASMGPQRFRCGNVSKMSWGVSYSSASMGPQRFRCGNLLILIPLNRNRPCFNGATTFPLWKLTSEVEIRTRPDELQWGHNVSVVEIKIFEYFGWPARSCFNGATTFPLWKCVDH